MPDTISPIINIVPVNSLVLHETTDPARVRRLQAAFQKAAYFTNPPIVAKLGHNKYAVLDGANRVTVSRKLKLPGIPVQVVDYQSPKIELLTWNHVLEGVSWRQWWPTLQPLIQSNLISGRAGRLLSHGSLCVEIVSKDGHRYGVKSPTVEGERLALLSKIVGTYKGKHQFHRTSEDNTRAIGELYPKYTALVIFPKLKKQDILRFSRSNLTIPSGVSRHIIPGRALRIDVPFAVLRSSRSLIAKNRWLNAFIAKLLQANRIRYYSEPIYIYDE